MGYIFIIHYLNPSGHIDFYVLNEVVLVTYDSLYKSLWAYGLLFAEVVFGMGYYYDLLPKWTTFASLAWVTYDLLSKSLWADRPLCAEVVFTLGYV